MPKIPLIEGRFREAILKAEREVASRPRLVNRAREVRTALTKPEAAPEPSAERAQNRHGGAPRGAVPVARDGPRFANVVSRCYGRDGIRIPPPGAPPSPRSGIGSREGKEEEPGHECPGNEETKENVVGWVERRARNPSHPVRKGRRWVPLSLNPSYGEARETTKNPGAATRGGNEEDCAV
jgi:hypothetical protein